MNLSEVDRTLYEHLRLALVAAGYLPDITSFSDSTLYEQALEALRASGDLVELMGVGHREDRDEIVPGRVVIDYAGSSEGSFSAFPEYCYERIGNGATSTFDKFAFPDEIKDVGYDIRTISTTRAQDRKIHEVVNKVLGFKRYLASWSDADTDLTGQDVLLRQEDDRYINGTRYIEHRYVYEFKDLDLQGFTRIDENIPALVNFPDVTDSTILKERTDPLG